MGKTVKEGSMKCTALLILGLFVVNLGAWGETKSEDYKRTAEFLRTQPLEATRKDVINPLQQRYEDNKDSSSPTKKALHQQDQKSLKILEKKKFKKKTNQDILNKLEPTITKKAQKENKKAKKAQKRKEKKLTKKQRKRFSFLKKQKAKIKALKDRAKRNKK
jgi:hypothetical protein